MSVKEESQQTPFQRVHIEQYNPEKLAKLQNTFEESTGIKFLRKDDGTICEPLTIEVKEPGEQFPITIQAESLEKFKLKNILISIARFGFNFEKDLWSTQKVLLKFKNSEMLLVPKVDQIVYEDNNNNPSYEEIFNKFLGKVITPELARLMLQELETKWKWGEFKITLPMWQLFVLTHVVEEFRRPFDEPLKLGDVAFKTLEDFGFQIPAQDKQRNLSRTPGASKLFRAWLKAVSIQGTLESATEYCTFVKTGGTSLMKLSAVKGDEVFEKAEYNSKERALYSLFSESSDNEGELQETEEVVAAEVGVQGKVVAAEVGAQGEVVANEEDVADEEVLKLNALQLQKN